MVDSAAPRGEVAALVAVQSALADRPGVLTAARGLSHFGEHSAGWLAVSAIGVAAGGRFYPHYYIQLIPPLAVLAAPYYAELWRNRRISDAWWWSARATPR